MTQPFSRLIAVQLFVLFIATISFISQSAYAGSKNDDGTGGAFYIQPTDSSLDVSHLTNKPAVILDAPSHEPPKSILPSLETRDKIYSEAGLTEAVSQLDEFDKDSIYLRLRSNDKQIIDKIVAKFSQLRGHEDGLKKAQSLISLESNNE